MATHYLFAFGGSSQHSGRACGLQVARVIDSIVDYLEKNPSIPFTIIFAAGIRTDNSSQKPLRILMKNQLNKSLKRLRDNESFVEPEIVLIKNHYCSIEEEAKALAEYLHGTAPADLCTLRLFYTAKQLFSVIRYLYKYLPEARPKWMRATSSWIKSVREKLRWKKDSIEQLQTLMLKPGD